MDSIAINILVAIFASLAGAILVEPFKKWVSRLLVAIFYPSVRRIEGRWRTTYRFIDLSGNRNEHKDIVSLKQFGIYIQGKNEGDPERKYTLTAKIEKDIFVTGTWKSVHPTKIYHGAFQLKISYNGKQMYGKWLGFDEYNNINVGEWEWEKID